MSVKIKSIYDALDHGNYKNCLKLCTGFLQKQPDNALCKALFAVALERSGRHDEALRACEEARACSAGVDDTVLNTIMVVYRRSRAFSSIVTLYKAAAASDVDNEEYGVALFTAALRDADYDNAQQAASKLYAKHKKPRFLHWTIVSLLLQARAGTSPKALDLAAMMLLKAPVPGLDALKGKENVPFNRAHLYLFLLHLSVLRLQRKHAAALELLEAGKALVKLPADIAALRITLCLECDKAPEAAAEARALVLKNGGDWTAAQDYIRVAFECPTPATLPTRASLGSGASEIPDHGARLRPRPGDDGELPAVPSLEAVDGHRTDDEVWNVLMLFRHLQQKAEGDGGSAIHSRIARLAQLELHRMTFCANEAAALSAGASEAPTVSTWKTLVAEADWTEFVTAIKEYAIRFARKNHCFFDLKPFLALLGKNEVDELIGQLGESTAAKGEREAVRLIGLLRRGASHGAKLEDSAADVQRWLSKASLEGADKLDDSAMEDVLLLAIVTLVDMDRKHPDTPRTFLLDAIALADMGIARFPEAFRFKVLLVLLHGMLGLTSTMLGWYNTMEIKNVQHESLSYMILDTLCTFGCQESVRETCRNIAGFHEDLDKDGCEALGMTLQSGVYHRAPEYLDSLTNTTRSILWGRAAVEEVMSEAGLAQTWDAVVDAFVRQGARISSIASKPSDYWMVRNQDRSLLSGLNPLPLCTPLGAAQHSSQAWRNGAAVPTTLLQSTRSGAVGSSALLWSPLAPAGSPGSKAFDPPDRVQKNLAPADQGSAECSAMEDLLSKGHAFTPARLKLTAATLQTISVLLQPDRSGEAQLAEVSEFSHPAARQAAAAADIGITQESGEVDFGKLVETTEAMLGEEVVSGLAPCGSAGHRHFTDVALRCGFIASESALAVLQCMHAKGSWEQVEAQITALSSIVQKFAKGICGKQDDGRCKEGVFTIASASLPGVWVLIHTCMAVVLPFTMWCCNALPKAGGSGKKVKAGQEALHATRVALRSLLASIQGGLADIHGELGSAAKEDYLESFWPEAHVLSGVDIPVLNEMPQLEGHRQQVRKAAAEAHRKQLEALHEAVGCRLALLKARGAFKP